MYSSLFLLLFLLNLSSTMKPTFHIPQSLHKMLKIAPPLDGSLYEVPRLDFDYDALEPHIDTETVKVHHMGHHAAYTRKMNEILQAWSETEEVEKELLDYPIGDILQRHMEIPKQFAHDLLNHAGGFVNHAFYWACLSPLSNKQATRIPNGRVAEMINQRFESFEKMKDEFNKSALSFFGSGYVWLVLMPSDHLQVMELPNQLFPVAYNFKPILVLDVWEHAYYLKHQNKRAGYISDWWNVVDWNKVAAILSLWDDATNIEKDEL
ncbi:superoxide dismutase [Mn]-like [Corticium candelabrum]|uniref:superoxide dismutase [Mn]-like n=1 Tax=Corticium candelabrum TaxID=121492 RepID=UPI002E256310|nr:superoxide dismutase [Mn]-like [Corticium candelabrum]